MPWGAFLFRMTICAFLPSSDSHSVPLLSTSPSFPCRERWISRHVNEPSVTLAQDFIVCHRGAIVCHINMVLITVFMSNPLSFIIFISMKSKVLTTMVIGNNVALEHKSSDDTDTHEVTGRCYNVLPALILGTDLCRWLNF